ncbi:MAG: ABC transporter ATP-binding protein [Paludibacter sp.]|jgi:ABC-type oligopeptide transport system ATPase subunit|nr:ABC transporter ATP-binding protein [Paludibacter sp.]
MEILEAKDIDISFYSAENKRMIHAVNNISLAIAEGEFVGLVGESGCGKSTAAKIIAGLLKPDKGAVFLLGKQLRWPFPQEIYKKLQIIFQLPQESFDPRKTIGRSIAECQRNFGVPKATAKNATLSLLERVGLSPEFFRRYPHEVSGGECQRAAIARAIGVSPKLLICDEITSSLDVSIQAQIIELLKDLRNELKLSALFISHDLALVQGICDRILVMYDGKIVEEGFAQEVLTNPRSDYTKQLLDSVFDIETDH